MSNFQNPWGKGGKFYPGWDENPWVDPLINNLTHTNWDNSLDTARQVDYLTKVEKDVILEHNKVRTNPEKYIQETLSPMLKMYTGNIVTLPGLGRFQTGEGIAALKEAISDLRSQTSLAPLQLLVPSQGLSKAASGHADYQKVSGDLGHTGKGYTDANERIKDEVDPDPMIPGSPYTAENLQYGLVAKSGKYVVAMLLIDDNYYSRAHRKIIMRPDLKYIGVGIANHPKTQLSCVVDYTTGHTEK